MVLRDTYINKIRELGYSLKNETKRVHIWRKKGGTQYLTGHKCDRLEDEFVRSSLTQAGMSMSDIKKFLSLHSV
jgi:hypothetical protein